MATDWELFFRANEDYRILASESNACYNAGGCFSVEELYQAFKQRLEDELSVESLEQLETKQ